MTATIRSTVHANRASSRVVSREEYFEHRCICMPALMSVEELEAKEKKFLRENPEW
jgi:hypothetical protein